MLSHVRKLIYERANRERLYSTDTYWDAKAASYEDSSVSMWPNQALNVLYESEQRILTKDVLGEIQGKAVLDLGCGTGSFSRWFVEMGADVTGIDFSSGALGIAVSKTSGANPIYQQASVFDFANEGFYDVVFVRGLLSVACSDRGQLVDALQRIRRSLRKGGKVLITEPIHSGFLHRVLDMNLAEFHGALREAGFEVARSEALHFWPMRLLLAYLRWPAWFTKPLYHFGQSIMSMPFFSNMGDYTAILAIPMNAGLHDSNTV